jgi:hypothetical protein
MKLTIPLPFGYEVTAAPREVEVLETRCEDYGPIIVEHLIKLLAWPSLDPVKNHWPKEIARNYLSKFEFRTKTKAKQHLVHSWLFNRDLQGAYQAALEEMESPPEKTFEEIEAKLLQNLKIISEEVTKNVNAKTPLVFTTVRVKSFLRL